MQSESNESLQSEKPRDLEPEQGVLGSVLLDGEVMNVIAERLKPDDFCRIQHSIIFESMLELYDAEKPIDLITLSDHLNRRNQLTDIGGVLYLSQLANAVPTAANLEHYIQPVLDDSLERKTRSGMKRIYENTNLTAEEMAARAEEVAEQVRERASSKKGGLKPIKQGLMNVYERVEQAHMNPSAGGITGIPSGFPDLDRMTSGWQRQDFVVIGARPSVGKTAFALNVAGNAGAASGESIAIFSLEMGEESLLQRMISARGNVDASRMRTGMLEANDWENMSMAIGTLSESNIFIDDTPAITVNEIKARCLKLKKETGSLGLVLIDYLQLIAGSGRAENRQQEISKISRTLKQIARELDTTVIALSQLSRGVEQRQDKRPMMSDLRESGSIEQDADIVAFLYRDDYYDKETEKKNVIEIIIAKQRNGPVGPVELAFLKNFNKFVTIDRTHQETEQPPQKGGKHIPDMRRRSG